MIVKMLHLMPGLSLSKEVLGKIKHAKNTVLIDPGWLLEHIAQVLNLTVPEETRNELLRVAWNNTFDKDKVNIVYACNDWLKITGRLPEDIKPSVVVVAENLADFIAKKEAKFQENPSETMEGVAERATVWLGSVLKSGANLADFLNLVKAREADVNHVDIYDTNRLFKTLGISTQLLDSDNEKQEKSSTECSLPQVVSADLNKLTEQIFGSRS